MAYQCVAADSRTFAVGLEGQCSHTAGATKIGSDEYADAARWLYGDLWSPGIEDRWVARAKEAEDFAAAAREAELLEAQSDHEKRRYWTAQAADDARAGRTPHDGVPDQWLGAYLHEYAETQKQNAADAQGERSPISPDEAPD